MEYKGKYTEAERSIIVDYLLSLEDAKYLDYLIGDLTYGYGQLTKDNKKKFQKMFLMVLPDYIIGEIYAFGWYEDGVRVTFYDFFNEDGVEDEFEKLINTIQEIEY
jgi:hypothetical protein